MATKPLVGYPAYCSKGLFSFKEVSNAGRIYGQRTFESRQYISMGDPRNVAHAKKVSQEKHHKDKHASKTGSAPSQRAKNVQTEKKEAAPVAERTTPKAETAKPTQPLEPTQLEKSLVVLSKLKELEFHSRANIEKLAELSLTIEEELKQKAFAEAIGTVYAAQDAFQSKIAKLIEDYEAECTRLKPAQ